MREVIDLLKGSPFAYTVNKKERALVTVANCSLSIDWYRAPAMKLVLDTRRVRSLPSLSCDLLLS